MKRKSTTAAKKIKESEKKCLESSNNKERLPLLESTKYLLFLLNRKKIFTSLHKCLILSSSFTSVVVFFIAYWVLWGCVIVLVRTLVRSTLTMNRAGITVVILNPSQVSVSKTPQLYVNIYIGFESKFQIFYIE